MANVNVTYQQMQDAASRLTNGRQEIRAPCWASSRA